METSELTELINQYGFPIVAAGGMAYLIYYVWHWVTIEIKPVIKETNDTIVHLIDRIRLLDNDLIRLNQKVVTVMELRGKTIEMERILADRRINSGPNEDDEEEDD
jgi:hypothetical protein